MRRRQQLTTVLTPACLPSPGQAWYLSTEDQVVGAVLFAGRWGSALLGVPRTGEGHQADLSLNSFGLITPPKRASFL